MTEQPRVVVVRPDDGRLDVAMRYLGERGAEPIGDPMLAVEPTGELPRTDADYVVFTSVTGVDIVADRGWDPGDMVVCAIGEVTGSAAAAVGFAVSVVPGEGSSSGLVSALSGQVRGERVEIARSDHGSQVLRDGLDESGAYHHETVLYRLRRPTGSGWSVTDVVEGEIDSVLFTSALTVEHYVEAARERGIGDAVVGVLNDACVVVGVIGEPTRARAREYGIEADVVASVAEFETLADEVLVRLNGPGSKD